MPDRRLVQSLSRDAVLDLQRGAGNRSVAQLFSALGNAEVARLMPKRVAGFQPKGKQDSEPDAPEEEKEDEGGVGLMSVLSNVNKAITAVTKIHQAWDELFQSKGTATSTPLPSMICDEAKFELDRALHYETSRLVCEYVFEKAKLKGVDLRQQLSGTGAAAPAQQNPALDALGKDLDALTDLATGELKTQAAQAIAERRHSLAPKEEHFWWTEDNEWGVAPSQPPRATGSVVWGGVKATEYAEVFFRPMIGTVDRPLQAGLHPDVRLFQIPDIGGRQQVKPLWFEGGELETRTHGRNVNSATVTSLQALPDGYKLGGEYRIGVTFDWDESKTFLHCFLRSTAEEAYIALIKTEGAPDIGWI
jgi:hypothetical protein